MRLQVAEVEGVDACAVLEGDIDEVLLAYQRLRRGKDQLLSLLFVIYLVVGTCALF